MNSNKEPQFSAILGCLFGIGSYWAWSGVTIISAAIWPTIGTAVYHPLWISNVLTHGVALLIAGIFADRSALFVERKALAVLSPAFVIFGTVLIYSGFIFFGSSPIVIIGSVISSIGTAGLLLMWSQAYIRVGFGDSQRMILAGSVIIGFLLSLLIICLPFFIAISLTFVLPAVTAFCSVKAFRAGDSHVSIDAPSGIRTRSTMRQLMLCCFVFAVPVGLFTVRFSMGTNDGWTVVFSSVVILIGMLTLFEYQLMKRKSSFDTLKFIIPCISGGMLIFPFLAPGLGSIAGIFILTGYHLFLIFIYSEMCLLTSTKKVISLKMFAFGTCIIDLGLLVGSLASVFIESRPGSWFTGVALGIAYLLFLFGVLFFPKISDSLITRGAIENEAKSASMPQVEVPPDMAGQFQEGCLRMGQVYLLSSREVEILNLLVRGRSLKSIAEDCFLSYNTVKTHVRHIYQKIGVHSREELIILFENTTETPLFG